MAPIVTATLSSSSTTSRLPLAIFSRTPDRTSDVEGCPATFAATQLDRAAVRLHDALRHPQPEAGALLVFGGEERLEDVRQVLFGDATARIADLNVDRLRHEELGVGAMRY